jgi:hypothetical protein
MPNLYEKTIAGIKAKKQVRESGKYNGIPFPFERYRDYFDTIEKGNYIGLLASSGIGKSRFTRNLIYHIVDFCISTGYKAKIILFALEDEDEQVFKKIIAHYLYVRHNISVSNRYLNSVDSPLSDEYLKIIEKDEKFWNLFNSIVYIVNDCLTPNQMKMACDKLNKEFGQTHHLIAVCDNYANIIQDPQDASEYLAVKRFSRNIARLYLCKELKFSVIGICQADIETEKNTFRNAGTKSLISVEPNSSSLGDVKVIVRDFYVLFGLFSPFKYEIKEYPFSGAYNIDILRNRFLSLLMLKNNNGELAPRLGMYFDGKHEIFTELPSIDNKEAMQKIYDEIIESEKLRREKFSQKRLF